MTSPPASAASGLDTENALEQAIVADTNAFRVQNGLAPLTVNEKLVAAANIQSSQMAQVDQLSHSVTGAALPALTDRLTYVDYSYQMAGENIANFFPDANSVVAAWEASPEHRANLLNPNYTEIGVGIAYDSAGLPYYTQEFGEPMNG